MTRAGFCAKTAVEGFVHEGNRACGPRAACTGFCVPWCAALAQTVEQRAEVTDKGNLRIGPGQSERILAVLHGGERVQVLQQEGVWTQIRRAAAGREGSPTRANKALPQCGTKAWPPDPGSFLFTRQGKERTKSATRRAWPSSNAVVPVA